MDGQCENASRETQIGRATNFRTLSPCLARLSQNASRDTLAHTPKATYFRLNRASLYDNKG
jgi:hypothetical protein